MGRSFRHRRRISKGHRLTAPNDPGLLFPGLPRVLHAYGFPCWKRSIVRQCFPHRKVVFIDLGRTVPSVDWLVIWGMTPIPPGVSSARVLRIEDGFLRSVGLGADLVRPISWAVDGSGIYYDATRPSDLEILLETRSFDQSVLLRAAAIRQQIVAARLTKYNVGHSAWRPPAVGKRIILVPGQVESDASLANGSPLERTNLGLLARIRAANSDAYIVYKPHPDIEARLRLEGGDEGYVGKYCDEIVAGVAIDELFDVVDEVHVSTSLAGFEALLRTKPVTCYGQPFYAGWGLTSDVSPIGRRTRRLTLDELVAGVLIEYPLYLSRDRKRLISPEEAIMELALWRQDAAGKSPWWQGIYRFFLRRIAGVR